MPVRSVAPRSVLIAAALDLVLVLVFVLIGRGSHDEGFSVAGSLQTAWPFVTGLVLGWAGSLAWRRPFGIRLPGIAIWLVTVAAGMLLRALSGQGIALSFVIVATIVLGVFLLGWRVVARLIRRPRSRSHSGAGAGADA